jgi:hypothetical protein
VEPQEQRSGVDTAAQGRHVRVTQLVEVDPQSARRIGLPDIDIDVVPGCERACRSRELACQFELMALAGALFGTFGAGAHRVRIGPQRQPFSAVADLPLFVALEDSRAHCLFRHGNLPMLLGQHSPSA